MDLQAMDSLVKFLRCSICDEYLICPPILLQQDSSSICGNCSGSMPPDHPKELMVREKVLEQVLSNLSFPCNYKSEGCPERLCFGSVDHKREDCIYRPLTCPTKECLWSGCMFGLQKHFSVFHSAMVRKELTFKLQVARDSEETILAVIVKMPIVAKCIYNADQRQLSVGIRSLTLDESFYKIYMWNALIPGNQISLKKEKCLPFASSIRNGLTFNLEKYLPALEEPNSIIVSVVMAIEKKQVNDVIPPKLVDVKPNPEEFPANRRMVDPNHAAYVPVVPIAKPCCN